MKVSKAAQVGDHYVFGLVARERGGCVWNVLTELWCNLIERSQSVKVLKSCRVCGHYAFMLVAVETGLCDWNAS